MSKSQFGGLPRDSERSSNQRPDNVLSQRPPQLGQMGRQRLGGRHQSHNSSEADRGRRTGQFGSHRLPQQGFAGGAQNRESQARPALHVGRRPSAGTAAPLWTTTASSTTVRPPPTSTRSATSGTKRVCGTESRPSEVLTFSGGTYGTVDEWSDGILTRGVLLDVPRHRGKPYVTMDEPVHGRRTGGYSLGPGRRGQGPETRSWFTVDGRPTPQTMAATGEEERRDQACTPRA